MSALFNLVKAFGRGNFTLTIEANERKNEALMRMLQKIKTMIMKAFLLCTLLFFAGGLSFSQAEVTDTTKRELMVITKTDGTYYIGVILSDDGRELLIETESLGKIFIPKASIKSITKVEEDDINELGGYEPEGVFTTRYYFTTNALPLKKGDDYVMVHLYGPEVHLSLGKGFSAGLMTSWFASPIILALKKSFKTNNEKINLSVATLMGSSGYLNNFRGYGGLGFGTFTYGTHTNNVSVSAGYGFIDLGSNSFFGGSRITVDNGFYPEEQYSSGDLQTSGLGIRHSPLFQLAATKKMGGNVSFIFDSMFSISTPTKKSLANEYDPITGDFQGYTVTSTKDLTTLFFIMPGLRFQKSAKNAFQIALAGCTYIKNGNIVSFPLPQCSWFFKF